MSVTVYETAMVRDSLTALWILALTSTWAPAAGKSGLGVTAPTSSVSGRSTTCPGVLSRDFRCARGRGGHRETERRQRRAAAFQQAHGDRACRWGSTAPAASVIDGWLKVAVTPAGNPEMLKL